jgi:hypothetical protein
VTKLSSQRISGPRSAITWFELATPSRSWSTAASPALGVGVVFEQVKRELSSQIAPALQTPDPWTGIVDACRTYIEIHTDPAVERIVLLDARAVLNPQAWRRVDGQWGR